MRGSYTPSLRSDTYDNNYRAQQLDAQESDRCSTDSERRRLNPHISPSSFNSTAATSSNRHGISSLNTNIGKQISSNVAGLSQVKWLTVFVNCLIFPICLPLSGTSKKNLGAESLSSAQLRLHMLPYLPKLAEIAQYFGQFAASSTALPSLPLSNSLPESKSIDSPEDLIEDHEVDENLAENKEETSSISTKNEAYDDDGASTSSAAVNKGKQVDRTSK